MVFIDMNGLTNSSKFIRSIKRGQIVMWLISARALDKVGPSICVFSASIGRIMHNTGLIVASRITVRAIPVVVIEMNGMPMARNFPFGVELVTEGESASVNYQILTSTAGFLNVGKTPNSAIISTTSRADEKPGLLCDREWSYSGTDGVMAYYDTTLIRSKAGNNPHNTLQPLYGVYRFRRTM